MSRGFLITFEGIDGSGKTTQSTRLAEALTALGQTCVKTREPGGSTGAELIRKLLVEGDTERWSAQTEILLFTAARRDHLEKTIIPSLEQGHHVISDRFVDSTRVYQGVARASLRSMVDALHDLAIQTEADLTFVIDMDPERALSRGLARNCGEDRFEDFGLEFQKSLRAGFLELAGEYHKRCHVIDGMREIDLIAAEILRITQEVLNERR
ncbi:thymidylate kinase [Amylibacter marinus]|uniref:Thymidylate kinase n=1 Tax=Amylibacter marinus TaxID=1475483 RepID=A0ABQ5VRQ7_9RHOB|nr:dTMP kinase [Amylibacter marinus]GLQ33971.1 thymidylate kinase [Amylibacter marinus]